MILRFAASMCRRASICYGYRVNLFTVTYLYFHLVFILPVIAMLIWLVRRRGLALRCPAAGIALLAAIAGVYTTPWDSYLIEIGIWTHEAGRTLGLDIAGIPVEEFAFFFLQPAMTGLFMLHFAAAMPGQTALLLGTPWAGVWPRLAGALAGLAISGVGAVMTWRWREGWTYLGLILVWAGPVIAFQWAVGGNALWRARRLLFTCVAGPSIYLWVVDMIAIEWGIWSIAAETSTGATILSLPVEEAVFFLIANVMIVQGLALYFWVLERMSVGRGRGAICGGGTV